MIRICGKCGKPFKFMDLVTRTPGMFDRHHTYCHDYGAWKPPKWSEWGLPE